MIVHTESAVSGLNHMRTFREHVNSNRMRQAAHRARSSPHSPTCACSEGCQRRGLRLEKAKREIHVVEHPLLVYSSARTN